MEMGSLFGGARCSCDNLRGSRTRQRRSLGIPLGPETQDIHTFRGSRREKAKTTTPRLARGELVANKCAGSLLGGAFADAERFQSSYGTVLRDTDKGDTIGIAFLNFRDKEALDKTDRLKHLRELSKALAQIQQTRQKRRTLELENQRHRALFGGTRNIIGEFDSTAMLKNFLTDVGPMIGLTKGHVWLHRFLHADQRYEPAISYGDPPKGSVSMPPSGGQLVESVIATGKKQVVRRPQVNHLTRNLNVYTKLDVKSVAAFPVKSGLGTFGAIQCAFLEENRAAEFVEHAEFEGLLNAVGQIMQRNLIRVASSGIGGRFFDTLTGLLVESVKYIANLFAAPVAILWQANWRSGLFSPAAVVGLNPEQEKHVKDAWQLEFSAPAIQRLIAKLKGQRHALYSVENVSIGKPSSGFPFRQDAREFGLTSLLRAAFSAPFRYDPKPWLVSGANRRGGNENRVLGLIDVYMLKHYSEKGFRQVDKEVLATIADTLSVSYADAAYREQVSRFLKLAPELVERGGTKEVLDTIQSTALDLVDSDTGWIYLVEPIGGHQMNIATMPRGLPAGVSTARNLGEGITGWVAENMKSVNCPDVHKLKTGGTGPHYLEDKDPKTRSELSVPIRANIPHPDGGTHLACLGVLTVKSGSPDAFSDDDKYLIEALATLAAQALQVAEETKYKEEFRTVAEIAARLADARDFCEIGQILADALEFAIPLPELVTALFRLHTTPGGKKQWVCSYRDDEAPPSQCILPFNLSTGQVTARSVGYRTLTGSLKKRRFTTYPVSLPEEAARVLLVLGHDETFPSVSNGAERLWRMILDVAARAVRRVETDEEFRESFGRYSEHTSEEQGDVGKSG